SKSQLQPTKISTPTPTPPKSTPTPTPTLTKKSSTPELELPSPGTVNLYFGSQVVGSETGIIYNNEMDDFSSPDSISYFGVPSSKANFIEPSASEGTKITTTVAQVAMKNLWSNQNIKDTIDALRIHHQLLPPELLAEDGFDPQILSQLAKRGHKINCTAYGGSVVQGIEWRDDTLELWTNSDNRKGGAPDDY
ncbi:unnamed protein product, partial [Didymodactylos carnosus]